MLSFSRPKHLPIVAHTSGWPVVRLSKQRKDFLSAVVEESIQTLLSAHTADGALQAMLTKTAKSELARVQKKTWKLKPSEEVVFWEQVAASLNSQPTETFSLLLDKIIRRYTHEIAFNFRVSHYRFGIYVLNRFFNTARRRGIRRNAWRKRAQPQEKIHIMGAINQLKKLIHLGTVVMVPTHFSHFDSIVLPWVTHALGLPHFIYGAGLNLFKNQFFAYLMNRLGVYRIDRRRKNLPYLVTLKTYSTLVLQWGCHSLFYPGGTRSRSGALEQQLKLGLLSTALEAQRRNYQLQGPSARKLFIVPVAISYHCVPEAPLLIRDYLATQGIAENRTARASRSSPQKLFKLVDLFLKKGTNIFVSIGAAMDLLGNSVDEDGHSCNPQGERIDLSSDFITSKLKEGSSLYEVHSKHLSESIIKAYYEANCILTSHLLAFTAFSLVKQQHTELVLKDLLQLSPEQLVIPYIQLEHAFVHYRAAVLRLYRAKKLQIEPSLQGENCTAIIQHGLRNIGYYHQRKPLLQNQAGDIITQDLSTLLYYHNRLQGYDLEPYLL